MKRLINTLVCSLLICGFVNGVYETTNKKYRTYKSCVNYPSKISATFTKDEISKKGNTKKKRK